MKPVILDYSGYVEFLENDEAGILQGQPTIQDYFRNGRRIAATLDLASSPAWTKEPLDGLRELFHYCRTDTHRKASKRHKDGNNKCRYCGEEIALLNEAVERSLGVSRDCTHKVCQGCGWWETYEYLPPSDGRGTDFERSFYVERTSVLREFQCGELDIPIEILRKELQKNQEIMYHVHPENMEKLVAAVFSDFLDAETIHVGGSGDGGIDVIVFAGDEQRVIQVKRRTSSNHIENIKEIREFLGAMVLNGSRNGSFVTTGRHYTKGACAAAQRAMDYGIVDSFDLVDSKRLLEVLHLTSRRNVPPYKAAALEADCMPDQLEGRRSQMREIFSCRAEVDSTPVEGEERIVEPNWINPK